MTEDRELWRLVSGPTTLVCRMITCCSGAELQVTDGETVVVRELYPMKSDLYERARELEAACRSRRAGAPHAI